MKHFKRLNVYKNHNGNNHLNLDTMIGTSYGWWQYVKPINGQLVFNNYNYSSTTCKHQSNMRHVLHQLGYTYVTVECPKGLQDLNSGIKHYNYLISELQTAIGKPRSRKSTNERRTKQIIDFRAKIDILNALINSEAKAA